MKTLRLVLADVGFGATVFQDINDNVDALLALPPTKLSEIMNSICKGATAGAGATTVGGVGGRNDSCGSGDGCVPCPSHSATVTARSTEADATAAAAAAGGGAAVVLIAGQRSRRLRLSRLLLQHRC